LPLDLFPSLHGPDAKVNDVDYYSGPFKSYLFFVDDSTDRFPVFQNLRGIIPCNVSGISYWVQNNVLITQPQSKRAESTRTLR
jgi:hypothetical protein